MAIWVDHGQNAQIRSSITFNPKTILCIHMHSQTHQLITLTSIWSIDINLVNWHQLLKFFPKTLRVKNSNSSIGSIHEVKMYNLYLHTHSSILTHVILLKHHKPQHSHGCRISLGFISCIFYFNFTKSYSISMASYELKERKRRISLTFCFEISNSLNL